MPLTHAMSYNIVAFFAIAPIVIVLVGVVFFI